MSVFDRRSFLTSTVLGSAASTFSQGAVAQSLRELLAVRVDPELRNPVFYWNDQSLSLVIYDHSSLVPADEAVAPGPCAGAKALGIVHAVIADAVSHVFNSPFEAQFKKTKPTNIGSGDPALFVGGAAWASLRYIYHKKIYDGALSTAKKAFLDRFSGDAGKNEATWEEGVKFDFTSTLWDRDGVLAKLKDQNYTPTAFGQHDVDPWNPGQKFYGLKWGQEKSLALADPVGLSNLELRTRPEPDDDELDFLIAKGSRFPRDAGPYKARTKDETRVGVFWAYDGTAWVGLPMVLYNQLLRAVAAVDGITATSEIPNAARMYAVCNIAMADASIVAWEAKWRHALWRPVRAIQALRDEDREWQPYGAPRSNPDGALPRSQELLATERKEFSSLLGVSEANLTSGTPDTAVTLLGASRSNDTSPPSREYASAAFTPNFPSYPSGHATFGGACFKALLNLRAQHPRTKRSPNNIAINVQSTELNGLTRDGYTKVARPAHHDSFVRLVQLGLKDDDKKFDLNSLTGSNDASRLFLGVHWSFDQTHGDRVGRKIGDLVHSSAYALKK